MIHAGVILVLGGITVMALGVLFEEPLGLMGLFPLVIGLLLLGGTLMEKDRQQEIQTDLTNQGFEVVETNTGWNVVVKIDDVRFRCGIEKQNDIWVIKDVGDCIIIDGAQEGVVTPDDLKNK